MTPWQHDAVAIGHLLREVLQPATTQAATEKVKELAKDSAFTSMLLMQMAQNPEEDIRQLAAVLLRRQLVRAWGNMSSEQQQHTKETLLRRLVEDPSHATRLSIAHLVSSLSRLILQEWRSDLFSFLNHCASSDNPSHREAAQNVFYSILDSNAENLREDFDSFGHIILRGLQDSTSTSVRMAAMKGVAALASCSETAADYNRLKQLIPSLVSVTKEACKEGQDDVVVFALEIFDDLAELGEALKTGDLPDLIRFMLSLCVESNLPIGVKDQALSFIHSIASQKPKVFTRNNLVEEILRVVVPMGLEADPDYVDADALTPHRVASQCVDSLALNLPSSAVFEPVTRAIAPYIASDNPWHRRGALILLGIISEGCEDIMRHRLNELVPSVLSAFASSNPQILSAVSICWGQMSQYLQPEISSYHETAMGVLLSAMQNPQIDEGVKEKVCYAVEIFCDNLDVQQIEGHLAQLMPSLLHALQTMHGNTARENCIGAIGSVAQASKEKFLSYAEQVYRILEEALQQTSESMISLRARATACAGSVVQALPKNAFSELRDRLTTQVLNGMINLDHYELREASYRFLGCLVYALKDEFSPLLSKALPYVIATLLNTDGIESHYEEEEMDLLDGVDSDEEQEDQKRLKGIHVRTGFLDEQEAALEFLTCLYRNISGESMAPWLKQTFRCAETLQRYFHSGIRQSIPALLQSVLLNVHHLFLPDWAPKQAVDKTVTKDTNTVVVCSTPENRGWVAGIPGQSSLHSHTMQLWIEKVWPIMYEILTEDDDKQVVGVACQTIGELLEVLGPNLLEGSTVNGKEVQSTLLKVCLQVFACEHPCQRFEDEAVDDDEDSRAIEEYLFEGVSCLVSGLAQCLGQQFQIPFANLHDKLYKLASHKKSIGYRCIGIGCYADVFRTMGLTATRFVESVLNLALQNIQQSQDASLQRNCAYCLGVIAEVGHHLPGVQRNLANILKSLYPFLLEKNVENLQQEEICVRDNAIAALGRILRFFPAAQLSLQKLVPLFLSSLPLVEDFEESEGVLKTLIHLYTGGCDKELLEAHKEAFLKAIVGELANGSISAPTIETCKALLVTAVQSLGPDSPVFTNLAQCNPKYKELLCNIVL